MRTAARAAGGPGATRARRFRTVRSCAGASERGGDLVRRAVLDRAVRLEDHVEHMAGMLRGEDGALAPEETRDEVPRTRLDGAELVARDLGGAAPLPALRVGRVLLEDRDRRVRLPRAAAEAHGGPLEVHFEPRRERVLRREAGEQLPETAGCEFQVDEDVVLRGHLERLASERPATDR